MNEKDFQLHIDNIIEYFIKDISSVHTGVANPNVLDGCMVYIYESKISINHLASISIEDSKTLLISPFDKASVKSIEQSINDSDLGLSVSSGSDGVRVSFPSLTSERRIQYVKIIKDKLEDARVKVRSERDIYKKEIENNSKTGIISKDEESRELDNMQLIVNNTNNKLDQIFKDKESIILNN